jgi:hypothetical protein
MLVKINTPPTISAYTTGSAASVNSYQTCKNGGTLTGGLSSPYTPGTAVVAVALNATEVDTLGDLLVLFLDISSNVLAAVNLQVVPWDPNDKTNLGLTFLTAITADPWAVPVPGAYSAGQAGFILGGLGSISDPWNVSLPGAYAAGKAGYIVGHLAVSTATTVLSLPNSVDTGLTLVQAIKLMTAVLCGVSAVAGFDVTFFDTTDTIPRVVATLDGTGQRVSVVYNTT